MYLTHAEWKPIADAVDPGLAVIAAVTPWIWRPDGAQSRSRYYLCALIAMVLMYALRAFEHSSHAVGPSLGFHYSSHTGFTVVLVTILAMWRWWFAFLGSAVLLGYGDLMIYQQYHSLADIAVTAAVICPMTVFLYKIRWPVMSFRGSFPPDE